MKTNSTQQEILLVTGTSFSSRQCFEKNDNNGCNDLNEKQLLEEACWNGMLPGMLPELYEKTENNSKLYLWQIREAKSFIEIDLGELPEEKDSYLSIDPYLFLSVRFLS